MKEEVNCHKCIYYFKIVYKVAGWQDYCKQRVKLDFIVIECPHYKPKADWKPVNEEIKEESKHIRRIERQRKRFDEKRTHLNGSR